MTNNYNTTTTRTYTPTRHTTTTQENWQLLRVKFKSRHVLGTRTPSTQYKQVTTILDTLSYYTNYKYPKGITTTMIKDKQATATSVPHLEEEEHPKNFLSDLEVNSSGWLYSRHNSIRSSSNSSSSRMSDNQDIKNASGTETESPLPEVFPACEKLIHLLQKAKSKHEKDLAKLNHSKDNDDDDDNGSPLAETTADTAEAKTAEAKTAQLVDFVFIPNVVDQIVSVFAQLFKMTSSKASSNPKSNRNTRSNSRNKSKPKSSKASSSPSTATVNTTAQEVDDDWVEVGQNAVDAFPDEFQEYYMDPSERTQITFNTIAVLLPILLSMMDHPEKNNFNVRMKHGPSIKKRERKKSQAYLFFEEMGVYSIATTRQSKEVEREIHILFDVINGLLVKKKCLPINTRALNQSTVKEFLPTLFQDSSIMTPSDIIQKTLLPLLDPEVEEFAQKMDVEIITPLAMDRHDMHRLHKNSVRILCDRLTDILTKKFRGARLDVYGSCLSGLSLGNSSDVDISIYIPEAFQLKVDLANGKIDRDRYQKVMKKLVYKLFDSLSPPRHGRHQPQQGRRPAQVPLNQEFRNMEAVPFARVPVVKGNYLHANNPFADDGSMHFDICILNDIAVANSGLLREYSMIDNRVKMLMLSVKSWIKYKGIGNAADQTLSSYTWMVMVIFYLQCIEFLPNLQCPHFMEAHKVRFDPTNRTHTVNGLRTVYLSSESVLQHGIWQQPEQFKSTPVSAFLAGFFLFYARHFPHETTAVSIRLGNLSLQKTVFKSSRLWRIVVEDPFETHDSPCPHDLGTPLNDHGHIKVTKALHEAADRMETMYIDCADIDDCIGTFCFVKSTNGSSNSKTTNRSELASASNESEDAGPANLKHKTNRLNRKTRRNKAKTYNQNASTNAHHVSVVPVLPPKNGSSKLSNNSSKDHGSAAKQDHDKKEHAVKPQTGEPPKRKKKRQNNKAPKKNVENVSSGDGPRDDIKNQAPKHKGNRRKTSQGDRKPALQEKTESLPNV